MSDNETNLNPVAIQQELDKFTQDKSNSEVAKNPGKLKERITGLLKGDTEFSKMKQGDKILVVSAASGLFTAVLPLLAVGATLAIPGAIVGLALYFAVKVAVKAVQSGYKGLEWSAKETVEGAKDIGRKIKGGAVRARDLVKETVSSVGQATREGTGAAFKKVGDKLVNLGASMSSVDGIPYLIESQGQTVVLKIEEKTKNFNSVKEMLVNEILKDKTVNKSALTKEIFSELKGKILEKAYSVDGQQGFKKDQLINQLKQQADFVNKLDAKKLQNLLAQDDNNLYEIFSEHHDEIKRIVKERKTEHKLSNSIERLNKVAGKYGIRKGSMQSQFGGSGVEKLPQEPFSSDLGVLNNTATVDSARLRSNSSSRLTPKLTPIALPELPRSHSLLFEFTSSFGSFDDSGRGSSSPSPDSGFNSPSSSPKRLSLFAGDSGDLSKAKSKLRKVGQDKLVEQQVPSTKVDGVESESTQVKTLG